MYSSDGIGGDLSTADKPVFFDPTHRRWTGFLSLFSLTFISAILVLGMLSFSIFQGTQANTAALGDRLPAPFEAPSPARTLAASPQTAPDARGETSPERPAAAVPALAALPVEAGPSAPPRPPERPAILAAPATPAAAEIIRTPSIQTLPPAGTVTFLPLRPDAQTGQPKPPTVQSRPSFMELVLGAVGNLVISSAHATEFAPVTEPRTYAFHVNWSRDGVASLQENILQIDTLLPEWIHVADDAGAIDFDTPADFDEVLRDLRNENPSMRIVPVLGDQDELMLNSDRVTAILANPAARQTLVDNVRQFVTENALDGIAVRFSRMETLPTALLSRFLDELRAALSPGGIAVYTVLPFESGLPHAAAASRSSDGVIAEGWDETVSGGPAGPLAAQRWFDTMSTAWQARVPADQLIIAIRNIAYDWSTGPVARRISTLEALNLARIAERPVTLDAETLNTHFTYTDAAGDGHEVWMLDAVSAYNQLRTIMRTPPRGIALSRLGTEDSAIWDLLAAPSTIFPDLLETLDYSTHLTRHGTGEIIKVTQQPKSGRRTIAISDDGQIIGSTITDFPRSYEIAHWGGGDPNLIALTFDDGPDPVYTAAILDILAQYQVPATFFATGAQMMRHPGVVERILREGHEVGSHTYSHTNISSMSPEMLRLDLNATQRAFEAISGRNLLMFRAPYAVDANPRFAAEIAPLATVGELGYLTVNMNIDPKDWWAPDANRIHNSTIRQVESGLGNVILLHDAGGNRSQTVEALPLIIEDLRASGYRFVMASELIGLTPDEVMPVSTRAGSWAVALDGAAFSLLRFGESALAWAFLLAIGLGISRAVILIILSAIRKRPAVHARPIANGPRVGIIVPAYNEEKVIAKTIRSLLASTYRNYEILIVDDGSRDATVAVCEREFGDDPRVRIFTKANGGKSSALNFGFAQTDAEVIVALDADTIFDPHAIGWLAARFINPRIGAVAGNAKVGNRVNLLTRWQATEYITSQNLDRRAFELLNCITVVPGAVGAWRREAVVAMGGYTSDTLAEDADLTIRLLRAGYKIAYEERAIALTEAPETPGELFKQRFRWMFGMLQTTAKHRDALLLRDSKSVALIALPHILVFQILFSLVAPIADIVALIAIGDLIVKIATDSSMMSTGQIAVFLALFFSFIILDFLTGVMAFRLEKSEDWRLLIWVPLQRFYYRQLLYIVALKALLTAMRGSLVGWGNLARTASVKFDAANVARR